MKDYNWTEFSRKIAINAKLKDLYDAWTIPSNIEKWFLSKANFYDGSNQIDKDSSILRGNTYEWHWYLYDGIGEGKINEANGINHIQFTFAGDCIVDVHLEQHIDYVMMEISQKNIPTDDESKREIRIGCDFGWFFYMLNLKSVYEGGIDLRNKNPELKGMLNN